MKKPSAPRKPVKPVPKEIIVDLMQVHLTELEDLPISDISEFIKNKIIKLQKVFEKSIKLGRRLSDEEIEKLYVHVDYDWDTPFIIVQLKRDETEEEYNIRLHAYGEQMKVYLSRLEQFNSQVKSRDEIEYEKLKIKLAQLEEKIAKQKGK